MQFINEVISGSNYCGPNTATDKEPNSDLDRACRAHDNGYSLLKHPYTKYNRFDEALIRGSSWSQAVGPRQKAAFLVAQAVFRIKKVLVSEEAEGPPVKKMPRGRRRLNDGSMARAASRSASRPRRRAIRYRRSTPGPSGNQVGRAAVAGKFLGRVRSGAKGKRGGKRGGRKGLAKISISKLPIGSISRALRKAEINRLPPIRQLNTGYGVFIAVANKMCYMLPDVFGFHNSDDITLARQLVNHNTTDTYGARCASIKLTAEMTNTSNTNVEIVVYECQMRQKKGMATSVAELNQNPFTMYDLDAADQPAAAGSYTLADQLVNYDMSQAMGVSIADATYFNPSNRLDTIVPMESTARVKAAFKFKKLSTVVVRPDDTYVLKYNAGGKTYPPPNLIAENVSGYRNIMMKHIIVRCRTFPHNTSAVEPVYEIGTPPAFVGCVWTKEYVFKPTLNVGTLQQPIQYITNARSVATGFDCMTAVVSAAIDSEA